MRRVVITGLGTITPIGNTVADFWQNLQDGMDGICRLEGEEFQDSPVKLAACVKDLDLSVLPKRDTKFDSRFTNFARIASKEAWSDAGLDVAQEDMNKVGVYISTSIGGPETLSKGVRDLDQKGALRISPYFLQSVLANTAAAKVSIDLGAKGSSMCHAAACASGAISIGEAFLKIQNGSEDIFIAGAADASITPLTLAGFAAMKAIYDGDNKELASIPFDVRRRGFTIGEGAGIVILEELKHAQKRHAKIYAEIVGYANNSDAFNIVSPDYEGLSSKDAMINSIKNADIKPAEIDYINAHGTSTPLGDKTEARAIYEIWKEKCPLVTSIKSQIGHLLSASGAVEAIATIKMMEASKVPGINYQLDDDCDLNIPRKTKKCEINYALSNSFGFGGHNACLVLKKWSEK